MFNTEPQELTLPISPTIEEIGTLLDTFANEHPQLCKTEVLGTSKEGRPIYHLRLNDPTINDQEKHNVLILGSRHGNEESTRYQALAIANWILNEDGKSVLTNHTISILPCVNPDGAHHDIYKNVDDVNPCTDIDKPLEEQAEEGQALTSLLNDFKPDYLVDMHSRGSSGASYDMVIYPATRDYTEDHNRVPLIANAMAKAGQRAGIHHITHPMTWNGWVGYGPCIHLYRDYKTYTFLTETSESNTHREEESLRTKVGVERVKPIFSIAENSALNNDIVLGSTYLNIKAYGETVAQRRQSRIDIWQNADHFDQLNLKLPEPKQNKTILFKYSGEEITRGATVELNHPPQRRVTSVSINDQPLSENTTDGYSGRQDEEGSYVCIHFPTLAAGSFTIDIELTQ